MDTDAGSSLAIGGGVDGPVAARVVDVRDPGWWAYLGPVGVAKILVLAALVGWFYDDQLSRLFRLWQNPDWSHGFLIPFFSLYLVNLRRPELLRCEHERAASSAVLGAILGLALMVLAVWAYRESIIRKFGYPQSLSILAMIAAIVMLVRGWRTLWLTAFPIAFLFLAIPPPTRVYREVTQPLQQIAAAISCFVLNALPRVLDVERSGVNLAYWMESGHEGAFTVAGACSGMRSLMAFVALGMALAYFTYRPTWQRVALGILVVPVAMVCNITRVIVTGSLQMYGQSDYAKGTPHTLLGLLMFAVGLAIYMGILWAFDHLFVETPDDADDQGGVVAADGGA